MSAIAASAAASLAEASRRGHLETLTIEQVNGTFVYESRLARALRQAGFVESPRGLTLRRRAGAMSHGG